jgi:hypothetical protein
VFINEGYTDTNVCDVQTLEGIVKIFNFVGAEEKKSGVVRKVFIERTST